MPARMEKSVNPFTGRRACERSERAACGLNRGANNSCTGVFLHSILTTEGRIRFALGKVMLYSNRIEFIAHNDA
jgi:hypothetical protein